MSAMERDIDANEGIYPFNGGRASKAEVCRRAGVSKVTLQGFAHRATTSKRIDAWLKGLRDKMLVGRKSVRKAVTLRADNWRELYLQAVRQTDLYRIEAIAQQHLLSTAQQQIAELELQVKGLLQAASAGKVVSISQSRLD
ncbi:hypothetical protein C1930_14150 [Stenotrophomonas sp. SAU14A_NAIMI4_8]|nr:hypothetical protein C1930_14150 [Stenotrophomonas sp. SAU14A_NAIMI4_8]